MGHSLFERHRLGYRLTADGRDLLAHAEAVERSALAVDRWRGAAESHPVVTIAAGAWTSAFIARHGVDLVAGDEDLRVALRTGSAVADLTRREANLGLRNRRPEQGGLAGQRLVKVAFAAYGGRAFVETSPAARNEERIQTCPWIAFSPPGPKVPTAVWLSRQSPREPRFSCSTAAALLAAARSGLGLCVLPCFIGDDEAALVRASGLIDELSHEQWLVSHDDDRHSEPIRRVSRRLAALVRSRSALFEGRLPAAAGRGAKADPPPSPAR